MILFQMLSDQMDQVGITTRAISWGQDPKISIHCLLIQCKLMITPIGFKAWSSSWGLGLVSMLADSSLVQ